MKWNNMTKILIAGDNDIVSKILFDEIENAK